MSSEPVVEVRALRKSYGDVHALRGVDFSIPAGEVVGFLGPNGAGKTTAMKILTGYLAADGGTAHVCGHAVEERPLEVKRRVGYLPENNPLYPEQRVGDFLDFAHRARALPRARRGDDLDRVVVQTGLEPVFRRPIGQCSKGFRQRVGLAQALLHDPPLLILDEPTNGLDPIQVVEIRELVRRLGETKTVILTSHVLPEVEALAERVVLVHHGRKLADAPLAELTGGSGELSLRVGARAPGETLRAALEGAGLTVLRPLVPALAGAGCSAFEVQVATASDVDAVSTAVHDAGLALVELTAQADTLEAVFRRLTEGADVAALAAAENGEGEAA